MWVTLTGSHSGSLPTPGIFFCTADAHRLPLMRSSRYPVSPIETANPATFLPWATNHPTIILLASLEPQFPMNIKENLNNWIIWWARKLQFKTNNRFHHITDQWEKGNARLCTFTLSLSRALSTECGSGCVCVCVCLIKQTQFMPSLWLIQSNTLTSPVKNNIS